MNQHRCETCDYLWTVTCPYYKKVEEDTICGMSCDLYIEFTSVVGCASHSEFICQGKKVMDLFVSLIISEMVYDDGDMYYKVNPEKYVEVLGKIVSGDEL